MSHNAAASEAEGSEAAQSDLTSPRPTFILSRSEAHTAILLILTSMPPRFTDAADDILDAIWPQSRELSEYTTEELIDAYNATRNRVDLIAIETEKRFH